MKIFLPITLKPTGGTSTFALKLQQGFKALGHQVIFTYEKNYDLLLVSPRCSLKYLLDAKRRRIPIIHRLDGVYYPTTSAGWAFPLHNARLQLIRNHFADYLIYQSYFSKYSCNKFLGLNSKPNTIIYNGVDTNLFSPTGPKQPLRDHPQQQVFITASRFRRRDQILPLLKSFHFYHRHYESNSKLVVIGNFSGPVSHVPTQYQSNHIHFLGIVPNRELPTYLRSADVFLFTHQNPPCPNNIIEAMACELPVCGLSDGAMPELVTPNQQGQLLPINHLSLYASSPFSTQTFARQMQQTHQRRYRYSLGAHHRAQSHFNLHHMLNSYLKVFATLPL
jgi:glycosyltransferase involved in cell wall biosynthesis